MNSPKTKYRISKIISRIDTKSNFFVHNHLTKKRIQVGDNYVKVLEMFKNGPKSVEEAKVQSKALTIKESDFANIMELLISYEILVEENVDETKSMISPIFPLFNMEKANLFNTRNKALVMGFPYGGGNIVDGETRLFPGSIRSFAYKYIKDFELVDFDFLPFENDYSVLGSLFANCSVKDIGDLFILPGEHSFSVYDKIFDTVSYAIKSRNIPIILGGDHSVTYPVLKAFDSLNEPFQLIHLDAHNDMYHSHINQVYQEKEIASHNNSNFINKCLDLNNLVSIHQIGLRGIQNFKVPRCGKVTSVHQKELAELQLDGSFLKSDAPAYISLDIDFFDPSTAPATATPVRDGASYRDYLNILNHVAQNVGIIGFDLVEVNPKRDQNELTMQLAVSILLDLINSLKIEENE